MTKQRFLTTVCALALMCDAAFAQGRETILINNGWKFSLGDASSMAADFGHGTEYFTYYAKIGSTGHNRGPAWPEFDDSLWQNVTLPHDWVVDLPYSADASHSHGYKCVGWQYPQNSVGWYRRHLYVGPEDSGKQLFLMFEGIFRDSQIFCNGVYLGGEKSGYTSRIYDITDCVHEGDNVITVRADASVEEGWYYEGAGIYRDVYLVKTGRVAINPWDIKIITAKVGGGRTSVAIFAHMLGVCMDYPYTVGVSITDQSGRQIVSARSSKTRTFGGFNFTVPVDNPHLWSIEDPYLYTIRLTLWDGSKLMDDCSLRYGFRTFDITPEQGFTINGVPVKLKGANMHLDHAGVGVAVPRELWRYRLQRLKDFGFNAIRSSHNPASPAMLDLCDEMGFVVIDEQRQMGTNEEQLEQLRRMVERDRNHACIAFWSIGNEEWYVEGNPARIPLAEKMTTYVHSLDRTRKVTYGCSGGRELGKGADVFGYNYIVQNPIDEYHEKYPQKCGLGTEETTGCGTRGKTETVPEMGWMESMNHSGDSVGRNNATIHGWEFYRDRPWLGGLFYWTGFDYRGEPNPMKWPATGSQFGLFDYCGYPKDEAWYLLREWSGSDPRDFEWLATEGQILDSDSTLVAAAPDTTVLHYTKATMLPDGQDLIIVDVCTPADTIYVYADGVDYIGWGNGDPGFKHPERGVAEIYPFCGHAQVILRSVEGASGTAEATIAGQTLYIKYEN